MLFLTIMLRATEPVIPVTVEQKCVVKFVDSQGLAIPLREDQDWRILKSSLLEDLVAAEEDHEITIPLNLSEAQLLPELIIGMQSESLQKVLQKQIEFLHLADYLRMDFELPWLREFAPRDKKVSQELVNQFKNIRVFEIELNVECCESSEFFEELSKSGEFNIYVYSLILKSSTSYLIRTVVIRQILSCMPKVTSLEIMGEFYTQGEADEFTTILRERFDKSELKDSLISPITELKMLHFQNVGDYLDSPSSIDLYRVSFLKLLDWGYIDRTDIDKILSKLMHMLHLKEISGNIHDEPESSMDVPPSQFLLDLEPRFRAHIKFVTINDYKLRDGAEFYKQNISKSDIEDVIKEIDKKPYLERVRLDIEDEPHNLQDGTNPSLDLLNLQRRMPPFIEDLMVNGFVLREAPQLSEDAAA